MRAQGALFALDDAGSGYSGLQQLLAVRPEIVKVDRSLVQHMDSDEAKLALVEMLGVVAGQLDAWVLAEGVETDGELAAACRLRIPLAQGWLLGRPAAPWSAPDPATAERIRELSAQARLGDHVASLLELAPTVPADRLPLPGPLPLDAPVVPAGSPVVALDADGCPRGLLLPLLREGDPPGSYRFVPDLLRTSPTTGVAELARRVIARPPGSRFDPVVCTDAGGRYLGMVRVERLLSRLADSRSDGQLPMVGT